MIEHADAALESWLASVPVDTTFDRIDESEVPGERAVVALRLHSVRERADQRDTQVHDVRDGDGRVVERRRSTRFFDVEYECSVHGPHRAAHGALGSIIQLLVDHEQVPTEHLPAPLVALGHPIDVRLVSSRPPGPGTAASGGIGIRLVVPVQPTSDRDVASPAVELHLDMAPPPARADETPPPATGAGAGADPLERRWTTVRRRELIAPRVPTAEDG